MAHIHEKIDFCSEVFIVYKDKVLLRMHDKYKDWFSVGGHIELDEDPVQAAIREVKEEVGLDVNIVGSVDGLDESDPKNKGYKHLIPPRFLGKHRVTEIHEHVVFVYFATSNTDVVADSILDHEKGVETKWFTKEDLENTDIIPNIKFYAMKALEELGGQ